MPIEIKLQDRMRTLSHDKRVELKCDEMVKILSGDRERVQYSGADYGIEIISIEKLKSGVSVLAKVWDKDGKQIGFGTDGSVEIERFRIFNPPILVRDPRGDITKTFEIVDPLDGSVEWREVVRYREDPKQALLESIAHTVSVKTQIFDDSNIEKGKVGNTTSTLYPNSGASTAPGDTEMYYIATSDDWATARGRTANQNKNTDAVLQARVRSHTVTDRWLSLYRSTVGFDTSVIDTDTIDSAVLSLYGTTITDTHFNQSVCIDFHNTVTEPGFALSNYATSNYDEVEQATRQDLGSMSTSAYNDFTLNATGEGNIDKTGNTYFATRISCDFDDAEPTWSNNVSATFAFSSADEAGTSQDPKLVVEHTAGGGGAPSRRAMLIT